MITVPTRAAVLWSVKFLLFFMESSLRLFEIDTNTCDLHQYRVEYSAQHDSDKGSGNIGHHGGQQRHQCKHDDHADQPADPGHRIPTDELALLQSQIASLVDDKVISQNDARQGRNHIAQCVEEGVVDISNKDKAEVLLVCGIGGSYLGARAAIEMIQGLYPENDTEVIFIGNTFSSTYFKQVENHIKDKSVVLNVISKSGTTTETAMAFRMLKQMMEKRYGKNECKERIIATTDKARGTLKSLADKEGYQSLLSDLQEFNKSKLGKRYIQELKIEMNNEESNA